jgi:hypothetical protein
VPAPGPGVCCVCRGPASGDQRVCYACRVVARRLGLPLTPVVPARLCPLPGPLYMVLLGYKEAPVAEARLRFGAIVRTVLVSFLRARVSQLASMTGGSFDVVSVVPSTHRPGPAPLARVEGLGAAAAALLGACWAPGLLRRSGAPGGSPPIAHMRPHPAAFHLGASGRHLACGARVLLLDDTYVSGARAQSAAAALHLAGIRSALIIPVGRVLRPDRVAAHADFLRRHSA